MRYIVRSGRGLGDSIIATPLLQSLHDAGNEVFYWTNTAYLSLFDKAPWRTGGKNLGLMSCDVVINMAVDSLDVTGAELIELNHLWWGIDSNQYVPVMFANALNMPCDARKLLIHTELTPTPKNSSRIILCNQTKGSVKLLSAETEAELIETLFALIPNCEIVIVGGKSREFTGSGNKYDIPNLEYYDGDVKGMANLMIGSDLFVGIDSGPSHLAAALGIPTVTIFGPTDHVTWGSKKENVKLILNGHCQKCMMQRVEFPVCVSENRCMDKTSGSKLGTEAIKWMLELQAQRMGR